MSLTESVIAGISLPISVLGHSATSFRPLSHLYCFTEATTIQGVNSAKGSLGWNQGVIHGNTSIEFQREIPQKVTFSLVPSVLKTHAET